MKRILIDENLKNLAADYVSKLPHIVGDVKARLQSLAEDLKLTSTEILIFIPKNNKKAKNNQSVRKKSSPNTIVFKFIQPLNNPDIDSTFLVLNPVKFKLVKDSQSVNILYIYSKLFGLKRDISKFFNDLHPANILSNCVA